MLGNNINTYGLHASRPHQENKRLEEVSVMRAEKQIVKKGAVVDEVCWVQLRNGARINSCGVPVTRLTLNVTFFP